VKAHTILNLRQALRWLAAYAVVTPIAVCCLALTKLLVLDRLMEFSKLKAGDSSSRWALFGRVLVAIVVLGSAVGLVSNLVAVVFAARAADLYAMLGAGIDAFEKRNRIYEEAKSQISQSARAASVHIFFEFIMMVLVVIAFSCAGAASIRRVRAALKDARNSLDVQMKPARAHRTASAVCAPADALAPAFAVRGKVLLRQILITCSVVFLAFLVRSVYAGMIVVSTVAQDFNCVAKEESICRCNSFADMLLWLLYTPQFYFALSLVSQPIALLVALWGMTSGQTLRVMRASVVDLQHESGHQ
jgi:hypothetical protein